MKQAAKLILPLLLIAALGFLVTNPAQGYEVQTPTAYSLCIAGAGLCALILLCFMQRKSMSMPELGALSGWCLLMGLLLARLFHCLARFEYYFNAYDAVNIPNLPQGGYLLYGAVAGVMLGCLLYARTSRTSAAKALDMIAVPGLLMTALARLAEFFTTEGRGGWVEGAMARFPLALQNEWGEWQYAVFLWEAAAALVLCLIVWKLRGSRDGAFLLALLLYACCQVVFESMRRDACPRFGFVRVNQVLSGVVVLLLTIYQARHCTKGRITAHILICILLVACCGGLEWALDKLNISNILLYGLMMACCAGMSANCLLAKVGDA